MHAVFFWHGQPTNVDGLALSKAHIEEPNPLLLGYLADECTLADTWRSPEHQRRKSHRVLGSRPERLEVVLDDALDLMNRRCPAVLFGCEDHGNVVACPDGYARLGRSCHRLPEETPGFSC